MIAQWQHIAQATIPEFNSWEQASQPRLTPITMLTPRDSFAGTMPTAGLQSALRAQPRDSFARGFESARPAARFAPPGLTEYTTEAMSSYPPSRDAVHPAYGGYFAKREARAPGLAAPVGPSDGPSGRVRAGMSVDS